jgi:hypothetical protein
MITMLQQSWRHVVNVPEMRKEVENVPSSEGPMNECTQATESAQIQNILEEEDNTRSAK